MVAQEPAAETHPSDPAADTGAAEAALDAAGVAKTFSDTMSGARDDRPGLAELMAYVRRGDTGVVWKLDRLGRMMHTSRLSRI